VNNEVTETSLARERLCIHQVTLMQCDFQESIECLSRHNIDKTAVWIEKLEAVGATLAKTILDDHGITPISLCPGGFLTGKDADAVQQQLALNRRWLDYAATIGVQSMVTITGGMDENDTDLASARDRTVDALQQLAPVAREYNVKLALEPLHPMVCGSRSVISTLTEAIDVIEQLGRPPGVGIALDSYALWWDNRLFSEIKRAQDLIVNFHVSDWLHQTRDLRLDRGMPGDGQINNRAIRLALDATGFSGPVEVEIFSANNWWKKPPDDVVRTVIERAETCL
jgi:sugar phosphate isomerase/epimerase